MTIPLACPLKATVSLKRSLLVKLRLALRWLHRFIGKSIPVPLPLRACLTHSSIKIWRIHSSLQGRQQIPSTLWSWQEEGCSRHWFRHSVFENLCVFYLILLCLEWNPARANNRRTFAFGRGGGGHILVVRSWRVFQRIDYCDTWSGNIPANTFCLLT